MSESYSWIGQILFWSGLFGLGVCFSWLLNKIWPIPEDEDEK